ncbi:unnamed protein product, partial [Mesorhabditis belari]|uniref:Thioredoxin domain-containing protein n=1 Tax=Mesorhabditis belari TaxID=2138241 RepID=A0AAF3F2X6_9BILA
MSTALCLNRLREVSPKFRFGSFHFRNAHFLASVPLKKSGQQLDGKFLEGKKPLVLYFSAGWCPSCRMFTPKFAKFYEDFAKSRGLEVVWVSRDKEEQDLENYYEKLPDWAYVPFGDKNIRELLHKYNVKTIPTLRLVDENGKVLSDEIRKDIEDNWKEHPEKIMEKWEKLYQ